MTSNNLSSYNSNLISGIPYDLIIFPKFQDFDYRIIYDSIKNINFHGFPLVIDSNTKRPITGILNIYNLDYSEMLNASDEYDFKALNRADDKKTISDM